MKDHRPKILIIYTGGTIGMIEDPVSKVLKPFDFSHLIDNVPKIKKLDFEIGNIQFDPPIDSSNMNHWGESGVYQDGNLGTFEANWVADFIAINGEAHDG